MKSNRKSQRPRQDTATDAALLARVAAGEVAAMGVLYDRYSPALLRFAQRVDPQDAEDLLHTTFLRVATLAPRFDGRSTSARAWLFAIITRIAQERTRSLRRLARAVARLSELPRRHEVSMSDARADIDRALQRMSAAKRVVLVLAEVEGFSCEEIAAMLNIPIGTVWTRLHHARKEARASHSELGS